MFKKILRFLPLLFGTTAFAQEVLKVQNGASITIEDGAQLTVLGNTALANGSRLSNNGTLTFTTSGMAVISDFHDSTLTPYSYGSGKVLFNSPGGHTIYSNNIFSRVDVNTPFVSLRSNLTANHWYLQAGQVITGPYAVVVSGIADTDLEAGTGNTNFANSWINGNLRRYIDPATYDSYPFAVGNDSRHLAFLGNMRTSPITGVGYIDATFTANPGTDAGLAVTEDGTQYVTINSGGVWHFVPKSAPASGMFSIQVSTDGFTGLLNNQFAILQRAEQSSSPADWAVPAGSSINPPGGPGRMTADGYALRNNVAVFGQFGIGQTSAALPVTLANFSAKRITNLQVRLDWQTLGESNNKGFGIERRPANAPSFTAAGFINSKALNGNSAVTLNYRFTDNNGYAGVMYYRIKQTDLDDKSYYSLIKAVSGANENAVSVLVWPNPGRGQFSVKINGNTGDKEIVVTDLQGKVIRRIIITGSQQINVSGLSAGTYVITIPNALGLNENFNEKIVVIK